MMLNWQNKAILVKNNTLIFNFVEEFIALRVCLLLLTKALLFLSRLHYC